MMTMPRCSDCKFFQEDVVGGDGECRAAPPRLMVLGDAQGESTLRASWWPDVKANAWCGNFQGQGIDQNGLHWPPENGR